MTLTLDPQSRTYLPRARLERTELATASIAAPPAQPETRPTITRQTQADARSRFAAQGRLQQARFADPGVTTAVQEKVQALKSDPGFGTGFWHAIRDTGTDIYATVQLVGDLFDPEARAELQQSFGEIAEALKGPDRMEVIKAIGTELGAGLVDAFTKFGDNPAYYGGYIAGTVVAGGAISKLAKIGRLAKSVKALTKAAKGRRRNPLVGHASNSGTRAVSQNFSTAARHLDDVGTIPKRSKGINGAHRPSSFRSALSGQGQELSRRPVAGLDGVEIVEYKLLQQKPNGELLDTLGSKVHTKTLFDPAKWPRSELEKLMKDVFGDATGDGTFTRNVDGNTFIGWVRDGELQSFGIQP